MGVPISCASMDETVQAVDAMVRSGESHLVITANPSGFVIGETDPEYREIYRRAELLTADGAGVVWALGRGGARAERVSGVDLMDRLCALSADKGYRVFLLGAGPGVAEEAAARLLAKHPGLTVVGARDGYFPAEEEERVARSISEAGTDILFVAMGMPRQEKFAWNWRPVHRAKVALGVGGSLDVLSGRKRRAPRWVQALRVEWLWRTLLEPKRWKKLLELPQFMGLVLRSKR